MSAVTNAEPRSVARSSSFGPGQRRAALLLIAVISVNASYTVLIPFVQDLQDRVGASATDVALTFALFAAAKVLAQPVGGWWVDRWQPGKVALASLSLCSVGIVLTALARDPAVLFTGRILWGAGEGLVSPALYAGISALSQEYGISGSRMMGNFGSAAIAGFLLGPLVAGLAAPVGLEGLFLGGAVLTQLTAFGLLYAIPGGASSSSPEVAADGITVEGATGAGIAVAGRWWVWVLVLGVLDMFTALIYCALEPVLPLYIGSRAGTSSARAAISMVFVVGLATSGVSIWALGRFSGHLRLITLVRLGLAVLAVGLAGLAISPAKWPVAAWFVVFMVGYSLLFLTARRGILQLKSALPHQGKAFGLFGMVSDVGNIVGPIIGVVLYEATGRWSFALLGALTGLLLAALVVAVVPTLTSGDRRGQRAAGSSSGREPASSRRRR